MTTRNRPLQGRTYPGPRVPGALPPAILCIPCGDKSRCFIFPQAVEPLNSAQACGGADAPPSTQYHAQLRHEVLAFFRRDREERAELLLNFFAFAFGAGDSFLVVVGHG